MCKRKMMSSETQTTFFSLGLTYWPRRVGFGWWQGFDRGEIREELAHVASLGCDTVRFCLSWEDFQPGAQRINSGAFSALEHALDVAHESGLRVVAGLFPVTIGGALHLPGWANSVDVLDELRSAARLVGPTMVLRPNSGLSLLYDGRYHANQANDLFADARVLAAQRYLIREVVGYFGAHPALHLWQLGEGLERVRKPSAGAPREWLALMASAVREQHASARVLGLVSAHSLTTGTGPRPEDVAGQCDAFGVVADPPQLPAGARANHSALIAFLHALTAALAGRPALVASMGLPTVASGDRDSRDEPGWIADRAYGRPLRAYRGNAEQQAELIESGLDRLQRAGATGAWLATYADYPASLWRMPPLDRAIRERTLGLIDAAGREKPAAAVLRRFAAERRSVVVAPPPIEADPDRYWRDPRREFARLWREFTSD